MRIIYAILIMIASVTFAQNPKWINYTDSRVVRALAIEGDYIWAGTDGGVVKFNKITGEKTFYNRSNSGLPDNNIYSIAIDKKT